ncbi:hypothetical protein PG984_001381 [Apiospora sp. TS-2023a]
MPIFWLLSRLKALLNEEPPPPTSPTPTWRHHPLTSLRWLHQRIRAERWDYSLDHLSSLDGPSPYLEPCPSFFTSPLGYLRCSRKVMARQRSIREIVGLKGLEVEDLYNLKSSSSIRSSAEMYHKDLTLSESLERAVAHGFWAVGWLVDWMMYGSVHLFIKCFFWKGAQWLRRIYVWWYDGTMAWAIECYAMPPVPCSALALKINGRREPVDQRLAPVVGELEKAHYMIRRASIRKGISRDSVKCSIGDLARLSWSLFKVSWRMSHIYISMAMGKLLRQS